MEKELAEYLRIVTQASYSQVESRLNKYGLVKGQAHLLVVIKDNDGCTQKDLSEILNIKYSSMSERLNKLEEIGYIERTTDKNNMKFKRIFITPAGKTAATQCRRIQNEFNQNLFKGFTKKDIKQFESYLDKIIQNVK